MTPDLTPKEEQDLVSALAREYAAGRLGSSALPFSLRTESQLGWLMLEWLGVLVPGAFRQEVRSWGGRGSKTGRRAGMSDAVTFTPGEVLSWPSVESMLSGEPPEGYDAALTRAAVESGGAITRVDPERGTVTVSNLQAIERESFPSTERTPDDTWIRCHCSRLVPPSEWSEPHGCCDDCYWALPDSREERDALMQQDDRERLVDGERD